MEDPGKPGGTGVGGARLTGWPAPVLISPEADSHAHHAVEQPGEGVVRLGGQCPFEGQGCDGALAVDPCVVREDGQRGAGLAVRDAGAQGDEAVGERLAGGFQCVRGAGWGLEGTQVGQAGLVGQLQVEGARGQWTCRNYCRLVLRRAAGCVTSPLDAEPRQSSRATSTNMPAIPSDSIRSGPEVIGRPSPLHRFVEHPYPNLGFDHEGSLGDC